MGPIGWTIPTSLSCWHLSWLRSPPCLRCRVDHFHAAQTGRGLVETAVPILTKAAVFGALTVGTKLVQLATDIPNVPKGLRNAYTRAYLKQTLHPASVAGGALTAAVSAEIGASLLGKAAVADQKLINTLAGGHGKSTLTELRHLAGK